MSARVLFVECGDSFTFNVLDALPVPRSSVVMRDAASAMTFLSEENPSWAVIGPGPFNPAHAGLLPIVQALAAERIPTLGICLGHQAIGVHFGAPLEPVPPQHGVRCSVHFTPSRLLPHFEGSTTVMRYHSLALRDPLPRSLRVIARAEDGTIMAIEHTTLPFLGLQFHPDSFATPSGEAIIRDFVRAAVAPSSETAETVETAS